MTESSSSIGLTGAQFWLLNGIGILVLALVALNITLAESNAQERMVANANQQFINQSVRLSRLHTQLVQGLANLSAQSSDEQLRSVLARHGISFRVSGSAETSASGSVGASGTPGSDGDQGEAQ